MKFDICIDQVFSGKDFIQSMALTKKADVEAYEYWRWWEKDVEAILKKQEELQMKCVTFCTKFISLAQPSRREDYISGLIETIAMAKRFGVNKIITQVGKRLNELSREEQYKSVVDGLNQCVSVLANAGMTLLVEPLNQLDHPGYFLTKSKEAFSIIEAVNSRSVRLLYDIYHFQVSEGNLIKTITENINNIGHFHCAGCPGRGEITGGEINYKELFKAIKDTGYQEYIGLECNLSGDHEKKIREARELINFVC